MAVHNQLGQTQNLPTQVERVTKPTLLTLLRGQGLDRLQVEVVVQVEIVEVLAVDQQVQHVVALSAHLQPRLHPVQAGRLEKFGRLEGAEEVALLLRLRGAVLQCVEDKVFEELLVADADFDGLAGRAVLAVPVLHLGFKGQG